MFGVPTHRVGAASLAASGVDDQFEMVLGFEDGVLASIGSSLVVTTSNGASISGTSGELRMESPFYRTTRLAISPRYPARVGDDDVLPSRRVELTNRFKRSRFGEDAVRAAKRVVRRSRVERLPILGNGYHYQAEEVARCIREGRVESDVMSLSDSIAVMEVIEEVRRTRPA